MTSTRDRLLHAVTTVLSRDGVAGLSLRKVAAIAGVSHAAPGVVFGDRAGLLTAYAAAGFVRLHAAMEAAGTAQSTGPASLAAVGRAYVAFALSEPELFEIMFRQDLLHAQDGAYRAAADGAYGPLRAAIDRCVAEGFVRPERAGDTLLGAWTLVHGLVMLWASKHLVGRVPVKDPAVLAERITALYTELLQRPG